MFFFFFEFQQKFGIKSRAIRFNYLKYFIIFHWATVYTTASVTLVFILINNLCNIVPI